MRAVIQRVSRASVEIENKIVAKINIGLLIFLGIEVADDKEDSVWLANKIVNLRIFSDNDGKMNNSLLDVDGEILVVSQFTLHAKTKKGSRPSYVNAARSEYANLLYEQFKENLSGLISKKIQAGNFGADMKVSLINNGPVTIVIDTKAKE